MKFRIIHHFNVNTETFELLTQDSDMDEYIRQLPNLSEREELEKHEDERFVRIRARNFAVGFIPKEIRHVVKPHMLSWLEDTVYDKRRHVIDWKITPHFFSSVFSSGGTYKYIDETPERMRREIDGDLTIRIPIVGPLLEKTIVKELKKNMEVEFNLTQRIINDKLRKRAAAETQTAPADETTQ